jgi:hypothetical protein
VNFLFDALRFENVIGQLYMLMPSAGSPLHNQYRGNLVWDGIFSEVAIQNWRQDSPDYALITQYPQVFPDFYAIPTPLLDRHFLLKLRDFVGYGITRFRWLLIALHQYGGGLLEVFKLWCLWCARHRPAQKMDTEYCGSIAFRKDFLEFVGSTYVKEDDPESLAVGTLLEYEIELDRVGGRKDDATMPPAAESEPLADLGAVPRLAPGVAILHISADYQSIIECLKSRGSPRDVPRRPVVVAERLRARKNSADVLQLSPLSVALIELCNGTRTVAEIAEFFPKLDKGLDRFPKEKACLFALNELVRQGLIVASAGSSHPV